jgi:hypothetical protein
MSQGLRLRLVRVRAGRRRGGSGGDRSPTNNCAWMCEQKVLPTFGAEQREREEREGGGGSGRTLWAFCPFPPEQPVGDALTQKASRSLEIINGYI